jgi:hypothetical protein
MLPKHVGANLGRFRDGHSKLAMVTPYAHPTEAHQFEAVKKLHAFMGKDAAKAVTSSVGIGH